MYLPGQNAAWWVSWGGGTLCSGHRCHPGCGFVLGCCIHISEQNPKRFVGSFLGNLSAASRKIAFPAHKEAGVGIIVNLPVWLFHVFLSNTMYLYPLNFRKILCG